MAVLYRWLSLSYLFCLATHLNAETLRDPMRPPHWQASTAIITGTESAVIQPPQWSLQGIITTHEQQFAIINGQLYTVGDTLAGYQIVLITAQQVVLQANGQQLQLPFPALTIKQHAAQ